MFSVNAVDARRHLSAAVWLLFACCLAAPAYGQDDFPQYGGEARRFYEGKVDDWTSGPAEMMMTNEERETWKDLKDTAQRQQFIKWFWERRDPDGRQIGNKFQEAFYDNVAEANLKFRGFPRGWKSDRGRVRVMFGRPSSVSRQTWNQVMGGVGASGRAPDFEIWAYSNLGSSLAFQASGGEFLIYFAEIRLGKFEVYDYKWGAGYWDRNIRMAFDLTIEGAIFDPMMPFEPTATRGDFMREVSEGALPVVIPTGAWADLGGGGAVSAPVQVRLGDLLFQPDGADFVARLDAELRLDPVARGDEVRAATQWEIRLGEEQLLHVGDGSLVTAVTIEVPEGTYAASLVVSHPLAATEAEWQQDVRVSASPATAIIVGRLALMLSTTDPSAVGVVMPADSSFEAGGPLVIGAWMRGSMPDLDAISVQLEVPGGGTYVVELSEKSWPGGVAGPLLIKGVMPELEAGDYALRVDFGAGLETATTTVTISG